MYCQSIQLYLIIDEGEQVEKYFKVLVNLDCTSLCSVTESDVPVIDYNIL